MIKIMIPNMYMYFIHNAKNSSRHHQQRPLTAYQLQEKETHESLLTPQSDIVQKEDYTLKTHMKTHIQIDYLPNQPPSRPAQPAQGIHFEIIL